MGLPMSQILAPDFVLTSEHPHYSLALLSRFIRLAQLEEKTNNLNDTAVVTFSCDLCQCRRSKMHKLGRYPSLKNPVKPS